MRQPIKVFLLVTTLSAVGVVSGRAGAAGFQHLAFQGLVPPSSALATDPSRVSLDTTARVSGQPGLKLPRRAIRADEEIDVWSPGGPGSVVYGGVRTIQRLGTEYSQAFGGVRYPFSENWVSTIEASIDSGLPISTRGYALLGHVQRSLSASWDLSFGLQYSIYEPGIARAWTGAGDLWPPFAQGAPLYPSTIGTSSGTGYEFRLNYRYGERNTFGLTYGAGREFDYTRQMLGMYPSDGRQFGVTGQHWLTPDWSLSYGLMAQEQVGLHRGQGLRLGLRYSF